jgi:beta-phosphoglucomutase-like phosphatase (HAD superfamily)
MTSLHQEQAVRIQALNALTTALAKRVKDGSIRTQFQAVQFVQDWTEAVTGVQVPAEPDTAIKAARMLVENPLDPGKCVVCGTDHRTYGPAPY